MLTEQSQQEGGIYRKQDSEFEATSWKREEGSSGSSHRNPVEKAEKVYVGHLPFDITKRELEELFGRCGPLTSVEVIRCGYAKSFQIKHGGFAFLQFREANDAMHAVETLNDLMFEGKRLSVQFSLKKGAGTASSNCLICNKEGHWARYLASFTSSLFFDQYHSFIASKISNPHNHVGNALKARKRVWM